MRASIAASHVSHSTFAAFNGDIDPDHGRLKFFRYFYEPKAQDHHALSGGGMQIGVAGAPRVFVLEEWSESETTGALSGGSKARGNRAPRTDPNAVPAEPGSRSRAPVGCAARSGAAICADMPGPDPGDRSAAFTFDSVPDEYERLLAPVVFEPWAEVLLDAVTIVPGSRVLDVATGTGVVARAAARRLGEEGNVVACDVSAAMLARAASVGAHAGAAPIEYREGSADALPVDDGWGDVVLCQQGLQFFPAQASAVSEMRRVLRRGGAAGIAVWASGHPLEPFGVYSDEPPRSEPHRRSPEPLRATPSPWTSRRFDRS
jgi:SAM-dependent methyltransferase